MILSNECWLKDTCNKYKKDNCECRNNDVFCIKLFKLDYLFRESLLPSNQRKRLALRLDSSRIDENVFTELKNIQDNIEIFINSGNNLYLYSNKTGNGKTAWSVRLLQEYFNQIWYKTDMSCKGLFISVPRYFLAIKDNISDYNEYANHIKDNVLNADLVIWDDIGTKNATQFEHENLFYIIDSRISENKCNIFTSNISPDDLSNIIGERLYSRIIHNSTCLQFLGEDKRGIDK